MANIAFTNITAFFPEPVIEGNLTLNADVDFKEYLEDSTIRSATESGYVLTRKRYNRDRRIFEVKYSLVPDSQKQILDDFVENIVFEGAKVFNWVHPISQEVKLVRFLETPQFTYAGLNGEHPAWDYTFKLQEA